MKCNNNNNTWAFSSVLSLRYDLPKAFLVQSSLLFWLSEMAAQCLVSIKFLITISLQKTWFFFKSTSGFQLCLAFDLILGNVAPSLTYSIFWKYYLLLSLLYFLLSLLGLGWNAICNFPGLGPLCNWIRYAWSLHNAYIVDKQPPLSYSKWLGCLVLATSH